MRVADLELRDLDPREIVRKTIREALEDDDDTSRDTVEKMKKAGARAKADRHAVGFLADGEIPPFDVDAT